MIETVLIVAVADNGVIGADGAIPWRVRSDMLRLKALTIGKPVVMGRKTFVSLKRPLPHRTNIVVTRDGDFRGAGAVVTTSLDAARSIARADALRRSATEIAVIGGAEIYTQWMPFADRIELTEVHANPVGDVRLAPVDATQWQEVARADHRPGEGDSAPFSYVTYRRRG
jgi:dihydrofolate reductase